MTNTDIRMKISRSIVRTFPCPKCYAPVGVRCLYGSQRRDSHHLDRIELALHPAPAAIEAARRGPLQQPSPTPARPAPAPARVLTGQRRFVVTPARGTDGSSPASRPTIVPQGVERATHEETLAVACPECQAEPLHPCLGKVRRDGSRHPISSHHAPRWRAAMASLGRPLLARPV